MAETRVAVFGAGGKMGRTVCRAVMDDPELVLSAAIDPRLTGIDLAQATGINGTGMQIISSPEGLAPGSIDVAVDFTRAEAAVANALYCAGAGIHAVVGTTGISEHEMARIQEAFANSSANCIVAANFAVGAVLMMKFAAMAAPFFETIEVVELHHENKVDAPSGTALATAKRMVEARRGEPLLADPTTSSLEGARGYELPGGVRVHSLRIKGMMAHQEVVLGTTGQTLTIRHDSYDRSSFMPGVLMAVKAIRDFPGVTVGLDPIVDARLRF